HYIGTEHILLGLLRERKCIAAGILGALGVSLRKARAQVIEALESAIEPTSSSSESLLTLLTDEPSQTIFRTPGRQEVMRQGSRSRFDKFTERARTALHLALAE